MPDEHRSTRAAPFRRRTYTSVAQLWTDVRAIVRRRGDIRALMRGTALSPLFRERLMLAVTEVNGCRYCAYYHARQALTEGLAADEIAALADGDIADSPSDERPALLYAQHWAEAEGRPDPVARERLVEIYGDRTADAIDLALRMIRVGNLVGNTWDKLLYRLSRGRLGNGAPSSPVGTGR